MRAGHPPAVTVAAVQISLALDDPGQTWDTITESVAEAAAAGADLVVLPELATTGSAFRDAAEARDRAEPVPGPAVDRLCELARQHRVVLVAGTCESSSGEKPYNSAVVIEDGRLLACYRKTHLWDAEHLIFVPGSDPPPVVPTRVGRLGVAICYDLELPEVPRRLAEAGAQILVAPANWPLLPKSERERPIEVAKAQAAAAANAVFVVVADRCGTERGFPWTGGSLICDTSGYPLAGPQLGEPGRLTATLDPAAADDKRLGPHNDAMADRRPELY